MTYINPTTKQPVILPGDPGEQNLAANKMGLDYVPDAKPTITVAPTANMSVGAANQAKGLNPDGTPMSAADKLAATTATGVNTTSAGTGSVVSTSAPVVAGEKNTQSDITKQIADESAITTAHNEYLAQLQAERDALSARQANEIAGINASFDANAARTKDAQTKETGTVTATLARIGGYLGESASATGALVNLNQTHQFQISDLESKRASAIQDAKNAASDKDFALARLKATEAKDYAKEIQASKQKFFENSMAITQEARQQDQFQRTAIKDKLANLSYLEPSKISADTKKEIDTFYGTPGFTDSYVSVTNAAANAKTQKDVMDARKATLEFLQNIPAGQKISMPDGTEYTGMGKAGDVATFMQTDNSGVGHLITYKKLTGQKSVTNLGPVGKASGDGSSAAKVDPVVRDNATNLFQSSLEQAKDPKTGQYDPDIYLTLRNQLKESKYPQLVPYMDKLFLDKANGFFSDDAISKLRKKGIFYGDTTLPDTTNINTNGDANSLQEGQ